MTSSVGLSACLSVAIRVDVRLVYETNERENLGHHDSRLPDAVLRRRHKSKMADENFVCISF